MSVFTYFALILPIFGTDTTFRRYVSDAAVEAVLEGVDADLATLTLNPGVVGVRLEAEAAQCMADTMSNLLAVLQSACGAPPNRRQGLMDRLRAQVNTPSARRSARSRNLTLFRGPGETPPRNMTKHDKKTLKFKPLKPFKPH